MSEIYNNPDLRESVIQKKAEILSGGESLSQELVEEAERHVGELESEYGSIECVSLILELEQKLEVLGISTQFFQAEEETALAVGETAVSSMKEAIPNIIRWIAVGQEERAEKLAQDYANLVLKEERNVFLRNLLSVIDDKINDDQLAALIEMRTKISGYLMSHQFKQQLLLTASSSPDGTPPNRPDDDEKITLILTKARNIIPAAFLTAAGAAAPPPPNPPSGPSGWDPKKEYEEQLIPAELQDIDWGNGLFLRFQSAFNLAKDNLVTRSFYYATLVLEQDGQVEKELDLSNYMPGFTVAFEGTLSEDYRACAYPVPVNGHRLVSLNTKWLHQGPIALGTIFHEIGHHYLFGDEESKLMERKDAIDLITSFIRRKKPEGIAGINHYQYAIKQEGESIKAALKDVRNEIRELENTINQRGLNSEVVPIKRTEVLRSGSAPLTYTVGYETKYSKNSTPEEEARLAALNKEADQLRRLEQFIFDSSIKDPTRKNFLQASKIPGIGQIVRIFHERNARAYAIRQIRRLAKEWHLGGLTPRDFLSSQLSSLRSESVKNLDDRFIKGMK